KMPGLDGLSAARQIAGERRAAVLILTAFSQRDLIEQARDAGALAYLVKPFQRSQLVPAVALALGRFAELRALHQHATHREGKLMDDHAMAEGDAFAFIQRTAMSERRTMKEIAQGVVEGEIAPPDSVS